MGVDELELARKFGAVPANEEQALAQKFGAQPVDYQAELERLRASRGRPPLEQADPNLSQYFPGGHAHLIGAGRTLDKFVEGVKQTALNANVAVRDAMDLPAQEQRAALERQAQAEAFKDEAYGALHQKMPFATGSGEALPLAVTPVGQEAALARVLTPALTYGATGALSYGTPRERALRGSANFLSGLAGGAAGEAFGRLINPVRMGATSAAREAAQRAADKMGVQLLPSQLSGSPTLARLEDSLARAPGSAGVMDEFLSPQRAAVHRKAGESIGTDLPLTAETLAERKAAMGQKYDDFRGQIPGMPAQAPIFDALDAAERRLTQGSLSGKQDALGVIKELRDKLYTTRQLTPEEYQSWASDLSAKAQETKNLTIKEVLKSVRRAMDQEARGPLSQEWKDLDAQYANLKLLMKPHVLNERTGEVNANQVRSRLQQAAGENAKTGNVSGPLADIAEFAAAVPQLRAGSQTFERDQSSLRGLLNALWRYPLAKAITSKAGRGYLAGGAVGNPELSAKLGLLGQAGAIPVVSGTTNLGLLRFLLAQ